MHAWFFNASNVLSPYAAKEATCMSPEHAYAAGMPAEALSEAFHGSFSRAGGSMKKVRTQIHVSMASTCFRTGLVRNAVMRTSRWIAGAVMVSACVAGPAGIAWASDPAAEKPSSIASIIAAQEGVAAIEQMSPRNAYEAGLSAFRSGDSTTAISALQFAAGQGYARAQWTLGHLYASGQGVAPDDFKAFQYFSELVRQHESGDYDSRAAAENRNYVGHALLQLGVYYAEGIPGTAVQPNPGYARDLLMRSAYNYGNANAYYRLARMHLDGEGVPPDNRLALHLLKQAADKGHPSSRALLGHLLFAGEIVRRDRAQGLMLMTLAREPISPDAGPDERWIVEVYENAMAVASEKEVAQAHALLEKYAAAQRR